MYKISCATHLGLQQKEGRVDWSSVRRSQGCGLWVGARRAVTLISCAESFPHIAEEIFLQRTFAIQEIFAWWEDNFPILLEDFSPNPVINSLRLIKSECQWNCRQRWVLEALSLYLI